MEICRELCYTVFVQSFSLRCVQFVRKEGEAIGFAKGEAKAERDLIKALHASGMGTEEIAKRLQKDIAAVRQILQ